jgi:hypothetical protein
VKKPKVKLIGNDGNAYAIIGTCSKAMKDAGWDAEKRKTVIDEMKSGDYDYLLQTAMKHFEVT